MLPETPKDLPFPRARSPWPVKLFATSDAEELLHYLNTEASHRVTKIVSLDRKAPFAFRRAEIDLGRLRLAKGKSTAFQMEVASTCLTLTVSEAGGCIHLAAAQPAERAPARCL
jgi:hypothetical protein